MAVRKHMDLFAALWAGYDNTELARIVMQVYNPHTSRINYLPAAGQSTH
jgi:hypothetical protein